VTAAAPTMSAPRKRPEPDAFTRAVGLLARREHSARELKRKLDARGISTDDADAALARLRELDLQNDGRFADTLIRTRISAGQGPQRIRAELATHRLDEAIIDAALAELAPDWAALARQAVDRRYHPTALSDPQQQRKAIEFLLRRGFDLDTARAAADAARRSPE
jgi:regulatory protein